MLDALNEEQNNKKKYKKLKIHIQYSLSPLYCLRFQIESKYITEKLASFRPPANYLFIKNFYLLKINLQMYEI